VAFERETLVSSLKEGWARAVLFDGKERRVRVSPDRKLADEIQRAYSRIISADERVVLLVERENGL
jgi:hypothetical protein